MLLSHPIDLKAKARGEKSMSEKAGDTGRRWRCRPARPAW